VQGRITRELSLSRGRRVRVRVVIHLRRGSLGAIALAGVLLGSTLVIIGDQSNLAAGATSAQSNLPWTVYHGDAQGTGVTTSFKSINTSNPAWTSPQLDGQLFGQPVELQGDVYVATENDTVYALSSTTGAVIWSRHFAQAVPSSDLPCGNISPTVGITGTPVIDPIRKEIFVVGDELINGKPEHRLVGLNTTSGALELNRDVDPPGSNAAALLQRTGLNLDEGHVVFAMGGNYGDCAAYRGRVVSVAETSSKPRFFTVDARRGDSKGAIWMGGAAPVVGATGDIWVSVGNGSVTSSGQPFDDSDSVLEISPTMRLLQYFAPTTWAQDNATDRDMTTAPVLLPHGQVLLTGKSRIVYLLNEAHLGGIGRGEASLGSACTNDIEGGSATVGQVVYLPCNTGPVAIRAMANPPSLKILWSATIQGGGGPPIVAAGLVWTVGRNGVLYGLNPSTGSVSQQATIGVPANHFPTPGVGNGLLLVANANQVIAFSAS
jgi:outer membrane protein assembly factor BamB